MYLEYFSSKLMYTEGHTVYIILQTSANLQIKNFIIPTILREMYIFSAKFSKKLF